MNFVVTAMDYTDAEAIERRLAQRDEHIASIKNMIADGSFVSGGAIVDENGKMIGSTLHVDFPSREALQAHLDKDPYIAGKVWEQITIHELKLVPMG